MLTCPSHRKSASRDRDPWKEKKQKQGWRRSSNLELKARPRDRDTTGGKLDATRALDGVELLLEAPFVVQRKAKLGGGRKSDVRQLGRPNGWTPSTWLLPLNDKFYSGCTTTPTMRGSKGGEGRWGRRSGGSSSTADQDREENAETERERKRRRK